MEVCNKKIIKVMIPCYNVEKYISRCIDSVLNQNYDLSCIKIVCINDGSTDNTLQILKEYKARLGKAFELHTQKNKGIWTTRRSLLLDNKNCDYLVCLDSDDTWEPNFLKHCSKYFSKNPDVIYNKKFREQLKNNSWKISWHFKVITKKSYITHSSGTMWTHMWSSSFLSKFAKLIPEFSGKIRSDDNIMCLVLNSFVKKIVINRHCDYNYFYYENSLMRTYTLNCFREEKNMLQKIAKIIPMNNKSVLKRYNHILKNC